MGIRARFYALAIICMLEMGCKHREVIVEGLTQEDANEIIVALWDHNIDTQKIPHNQRKNISYSIAVLEKDVHAALKILVVNLLPKSRRAGLKDVYPPGSAGLIPTKSDESARLLMALQGELESLIKALPQIADARVILSMDPAPHLGKAANAKSASLSISYRPDPHSELPPVSTEELANLVSSAVDGLAAEQVHVLMKALRPVKFLGAESLSQRLIEPMPAQITAPNKLLWPLLCLVVLALAVAAYAFVRPRFARRFRS